MKKIGLALYLLCLTYTSFGKQYLVKSEQEFKAVISKLLPGDEVLIADGTYSKWSVEISNHGTLEKPILIKAQNAKKVFFSGEVDQHIFLISGSNITLSGISFMECALIKANGKTGVLVEFKNSNSGRLTDCMFAKNQAKFQFAPLVVVSGNGKGNQIDFCSFILNVDNQDVQVKITNESCPQNTLISKNIFSNKSKVSWKNGNGGECIQIGQDPVLLGKIEANTIVSENQFINCNGESEIISNKSSKNQYLKNLFETCDGELVMRGGHDCIIAENTFNEGTGGIRINGTGHQVIDNKVSNIKTAIRLMYGMAKGKEEIGFYIAASNCTIKGNHIDHATTGILIGDSKNTDWTGKFDTKRYPSPVMQNIAPFDNKIENNSFSDTIMKVVNQ